jgi:hypothetical protein
MRRAGLQSVSAWALGVVFACALLEVPALPPAGHSPEIAPASSPRHQDPPLRKEDKLIEFAPWEEVPA